MKWTPLAILANTIVIVILAVILAVPIVLTFFKGNAWWLALYIGYLNLWVGLSFILFKKK